MSDNLGKIELYCYTGACNACADLGEFNRLKGLRQVSLVLHRFQYEQTESCVTMKIQIHQMETEIRS